MSEPTAAAHWRARVDSAIKLWLRRLRLAEARRKQQRFIGRYVAVTGSCGKTTTTALIGGLLGCYGSSTFSRENGGIRLARDVRHLRAPVDYFVQETSGHMPGAMDLQVSAFRIDVAVVTAVGFDHGSNFRLPDIDVPDAIAREKGRLVEAVTPGGFACLNFDDPRVRAMAARTEQRVVGFGTSDDADVRAVNVRAAWPARLSFDLVIGDRTYPVVTRFVGTMMLTNLLGALAVVHGCGLPLEAAIARLAVVEPVSDRMGVHRGRDGKTYIMDTVKAPYWSTELMLEDLPRMAIPSLTFVIGDLSDTRGATGAQYRKLLRRLAGRVETVVLVGRSAEHGAKLQKDGVANLVVAPTAYDVAKYLDTRPPGVVLLKANSTSQLWRVLDQVTPADQSVAA